MCQIDITSSTTGLLPNTRTVTITTFPFIGLATPVNVAWAATDLAAFTPASAPLKVLTAIQSSPATPLSSGAKAGIGVGVAVAVLVLLGAAFLLLRIMKRRKQSHVEPVSVEEKSELQGEPVYRMLPTELDTENGIKEMQDNHCTVEMDPSGAKQELEAPDVVHELP